MIITLMALFCAIVCDNDVGVESCNKVITVKHYQVALKKSSILNLKGN